MYMKNVTATVYKDKGKITLKSIPARELSAGKESRTSTQYNAILTAIFLL